MTEAEYTAAVEKIRNLELALATRQRIGMAIGIVIATYKITEQMSFDLLVMASQHTHRKLREVADSVVETGDLVWAPGMWERKRARPTSPESQAAERPDGGRGS